MVHIKGLNGKPVMYSHSESDAGAAPATVSESLITHSHCAYAWEGVMSRNLTSPDTGLLLFGFELRWVVQAVIWSFVIGH